MGMCAVHLDKGSPRFKGLPAVPLAGLPAVPLAGLPAVPLAGLPAVRVNPCLSAVGAKPFVPYFPERFLS
jgi:hypothetical protein